MNEGVKALCIIYDRKFLLKYLIAERSGAKWNFRFSFSGVYQMDI